VLVLTPVKDAGDCLDGYFSALERLDHPPESPSLGFLESDSTDDTHARLVDRREELSRRHRTGCSSTPCATRSGCCGSTSM
jgi:hypothetical protein